ncbi:hypothetical protein L1D15_13955 [Vibrio sp. Isolate25]|uniref:hypothetical protein n=1 Tax=Vibrio sp. Isolate25 TaxID=2908535 RepID=UPI001EFC9B08|nr:hypothetical protein [Vibrio sp. Isolate25]MCG9597822.1 hypothetical protein [Vibrio sp. Isolate25]
MSATVVLASETLKQPFSQIEQVDFIYLNNKNAKAEEVTTENNKRKRKENSVLHLFLKRILLTPLSVLSFYKKYLSIKKSVPSNFKQALIANDRSYADGYILPFYYFCKKEKIKMIIPSTATFATKEGMLRARVSRKEKFAVTWLEKVLCNHLVVDFEGTKLCYYPINTIIALKIFGVLSKNPWVMGANNNATLCLNNQKSKLEYLNAGVDEENIIVTGSYKIKDAYLNERKRIGVIGFALPQMYEHDILSWSEHIAIIENVLSGICNLEKEVIVFLHPKMDKSNYHYLESRYNCKISEQRTDVGLKSVDIYIATFSTTVLTATTHGIPSLVIDCFDANYKMFDDYASIKVFKEIQCLVSELGAYVRDPNRYVELKKEVFSDSKLIDDEPGRGMLKLKQLIENEIQL